MSALLIALLFTVAIAVSIWSMWITIAPRLDYMRALLADDTVPALASAPAPRVRALRPAAATTTGVRPLRAAA